MKTKLFTLLIGSLAFTAISSSAAPITIDIDVNDFRNSSGETTSTNGTLVQTAITTGASAFSTFQITGVDLSSIGGTSNETIDFTIDYSGSSSNVNVKSWGDAYIGGANTEVGETFRADFGSISSSYGTVNFVGFTNAYIEAISDSSDPDETADVTHDGGTISATGVPANKLDVSFPASSFFTIAPTEGAMNIGGYDLQISVIPEPSSLVLILVALLSGIAVMRKHR